MADQNALDILKNGFTEPVRDVLWGHIYLTEGLLALTQSAPFLRLHRIFQLGPAYRSYPGATHTRAAHSIGVCHLARRLLLNLAERGASSWLSPDGVRSFLCAALLHDAGHFPYTHSLKELPLQSHEALTGQLILTEPLKSLVAKARADPYFSAAIVDTGLRGEGAELTFYRKLLSGALDPDKLDYLNRDARYCGVPYGAQDVDFILSRILPHQERGVDIDSRLIPSVESILFSKYLMYRAVYWLKPVRSATAMIKKALLGALEDGTVQQEELYGLDDSGLFSLMADRSHSLFFLAAQVSGGRLYSAATEFPFDASLHQGLLDIQSRSRYEASLARELSAALGCTIPPEALIIDIPEPVSFETGLFVWDENRYFAECSGIFSSDALENCIKTLRIIRIFVDPEIENRVKSYNKLFELLHTKQKWLQLM